MLVKNDRIRLVEAIGNFDKVGEEFTVTDIQNGNVSIECRFGVGVMSYDEFEKHFEKVVERTITITQKEYDKLINENESYKEYIKSLISDLHEITNEDNDDDFDDDWN